jgi:hypothetical protein
LIILFYHKAVVEGEEETEMSLTSLWFSSCSGVLLIQFQRWHLQLMPAPGLGSTLGLDAGFPIWPTVPYGHFGSGSTEGEQNALR